MSAKPIQMRSVGMLFIRALLGIILFMQGFGKVFTIGIAQVYDMFFKTYEDTFLPIWLILTTAYYTSFIELIGGAFLVIGLFRKYTLYFIVADLLIVSFGHGMIQPIWDLQHVMPRSILVVALLLLPQEWDCWSLDNRLSKANGVN